FVFHGQRQRFFGLACVNDLVTVRQIQPYEPPHRVIVIHDQESLHVYASFLSPVRCYLPASTAPSVRSVLRLPASRTSRILRTNSSSVKGLCNKEMPGSRTPCCPMELSV